MIHQLIFAHPRPGMTEEEFQRYWVDVHAVRYAGKIPQIRRYLIDTRIPFGVELEDPLWSGVAEIWIEDEADQLASLQSREFLEGARIDEPRWAAFWRTLVLDTDTHVVVDGEEPARSPASVKLLELVKRKEGMPLAAFRRHMLDVHGPLVQAVPGLRRYVQCHVRDSFYAVGEATLDAVSQLSFDDAQALRDAMGTPEYAAVGASLEGVVEPRYVHSLVTRENWIIGPQAR